MKASGSRRPAAKKVDTILLVDRFEKRRRWPWVAGGVALVGAAVGVWAMTSKPSAPKPKSTAGKSAALPAPTSSSSVRVATAAASASPTSGLACDVDRCTTFSPPDPSRVDAEFLFGEVDKAAKAVDPGAALGSATLDGCIAEGSIDLTRAGGIASFTFDLPAGGLTVTVDRAALRVKRFVNDYMERVAPDVPCPFKQAFTALAASRFPFTDATHASLTVGSIAGKSSWVFHTGAEIGTVEGPSCVVKR